MVDVPASVLERYRAFSLYNSPYRAHEAGRAIDLYPDTGAPSPVSGEVVAIERVSAPPKPYAPEHDWLLAIDTGARPGGPEYRTPSGEPAVARILHVDPSVEAGDHVAVGEELGDPVRAGFFAPWVDRHLHLGFRDHASNLRRASGSLEVEPGMEVVPVEWDGTGTVVEVGETYAVLDRPTHPAPGECFASIAGTLESDTGPPPQCAGSGDERSVALDGGLPHYEHGGVFGDSDGEVSLLGTHVGTATSRTVAWNDPTVLANGAPIHGLSLAAARDRLGAKLVCPDRAFDVGESVRVGLRT